MIVNVLYFAEARDRVGHPSEALEVADGAQLEDALALIERRHPELAELWPHLAVAVDGVLAARGARLPTEPRSRCCRRSAEADRAARLASRGRGAGMAERWDDSRGCSVQMAHAPAAGACGRASGRRVSRAAPARAIGRALRAAGGRRRSARSARVPRRRAGRLVRGGAARRYPRVLETREPLAPVDDRPVWSVACFFIAPSIAARRAQRCSCCARRALRGARGAQLLEGYPIDPRDAQDHRRGRSHGLAVTFRAAGFREVARRSPTRPIMRRAGLAHDARRGAQQRGPRRRDRPRAGGARRG